MSQLITGNYVIKFERISFRVQLSARGIAICFASAQPKAHVRGGKWSCGLSLSLSLSAVKSKTKSQISTTLAIFGTLTRDCKGLLVAQALLQVTAKLAQQADSLSVVEMLWLTAHCLASQAGLFSQTALPS